MKKFFVIAMIAVLAATAGVGGTVGAFVSNVYAATQEDAKASTQATTQGLAGKRYEVTFEWPEEYSSNVVDFEQYKQAYGDGNGSPGAYTTSLWVDFGTQEPENPYSWHWFETPDSKYELKSIPWHIFGTDSFLGAYFFPSGNSYDFADCIQIVGVDGTFYRLPSLDDYNSNAAVKLKSELEIRHEVRVSILFEDFDNSSYIDGLVNPYNNDFSQGNSEIAYMELSSNGARFGDDAGFSYDGQIGVFYDHEIDYGYNINAAWAMWSHSWRQFVVVDTLKEAIVVAADADFPGWNEGAAEIDLFVNGDVLGISPVREDSEFWKFVAYHTAELGDFNTFVDGNGNFRYDFDFENNLHGYTGTTGDVFDPSFALAVTFDLSKVDPFPYPYVNDETLPYSILYVDPDEMKWYDPITFEEITAVPWSMFMGTTVTGSFRAVNGEEYQVVRDNELLLDFLEDDVVKSELLENALEPIELAVSNESYIAYSVNLEVSDDFLLPDLKTVAQHDGWEGIPAVWSLAYDGYVWDVWQGPGISQTYTISNLNQLWEICGLLEDATQSNSCGLESDLYQVNLSGIYMTFNTPGVWFVDGQTPAGDTFDENNYYNKPTDAGQQSSRRGGAIKVVDEKGNFLSISQDLYDYFITNNQAPYSPILSIATDEPELIIQLNKYDKSGSQILDGGFGLNLRLGKYHGLGYIGYDGYNITWFGNTFNLNDDSNTKLFTYDDVELTNIDEFAGYYVADGSGNGQKIFDGNCDFVASWDDFAYKYTNQFSSSVDDKRSEIKIMAHSKVEAWVQFVLHPYAAPGRNGPSEGVGHFTDGTKTAKTLYWSPLANVIAESKNGEQYACDRNVYTWRELFEKKYMIDSRDWSLMNLYTQENITFPNTNTNSLVGFSNVLEGQSPEDAFLVLREGYAGDQNLASSYDLYARTYSEFVVDNAIEFTLNKAANSNFVGGSNNITSSTSTATIYWQADENQFWWKNGSKYEKFEDNILPDAYKGVKTSRPEEWTFNGYFSGTGGAGYQIFGDHGNGFKAVGGDPKNYLDNNYSSWKGTTQNLYMYFSPVQHSITLDKNGGEFNLPSGDLDYLVYYTYETGFVDSRGKSIDFVQCFKLTSPEYKPTRDKYTFLGYYTQASGGVCLIDATGKVTKATCDTQILDNGITTLYAHWEPDEVDLGDGSDGQGATGVTSVSVNFDDPGAVYNGQKWEPTVKTVTVVFSDGRGTASLTEANGNFTVGYGDNINAGQGTITVTFKGTYKGSRTATFTIAPKNIDSADVEIELMQTVASYGEMGMVSGSPRPFQPAVKKISDNTVGATIALQYYSVTYGSNIHTNDWISAHPSSSDSNYAAITGRGNYTGTKTIYLTINRAAIQTVNISSTELIYNGASQQPSITLVTDASRHEVSSTYYTVSVVGTTSDTIVSPIAAGTYRLKVSAASNQYYYQGAQYVQFEIKKGSISGGEGSSSGSGTGSGLKVTVSNNTTIYNRLAQYATVTITLNGRDLSKDTDFSVTYKTSTQNNVTPTDAGTYTIHVSALGSNYSGSFDCTTRFVIQKASLNGGTVSASVAHDTYAGPTNAITIDSVKTNRTNKSLTLNPGEYTYSPENADGTGTISVTVYGRGNFTGSATTSVSVAKATLSKFKITANGYSSGSSTQTSPTLSVTYKGSAYSPSYTVEANTGVTLSGSDYSVAYKRGSYATSDLTSSGTITVTISANSDNFTGSLTGTIEISQRTMTDGDSSLSFSWTRQNVVWHPSSARSHEDANPSFTISWGGSYLDEYTDYTTSYDISSVGNNKALTISFQGDFSGSITKYFNVTARTFGNVTFGSIGNQTYTGSALQPSFTARDTEAGNYSLRSGTDYDAVYSSNTNRGQATVTITGRGGYAGASHTLHFQIVGKSISGCTIEGVNDKYTYGDDIMLNPTVKDGGTTLQEGEDYTWKLQKKNGNGGWDDLSSKTPDGAGSYRVVVEGQENYSGQITKEFTVEAKSMGGGSESTEGNDEGHGENSKFEWDVDFSSTTGKRFVFDRTAHTPGVTVKEKGGKTLQSGVDYELKYDNNTNAGTATITITAKGNYSGALTAHFVIDPAQINSLTLSQTTAIYNMKPQNDNIKIGSVKTANSLTLTTDEYKVTYSYKGVNSVVANPTNAGTVTVKVEKADTAKGNNFQGSATAEFTINKAVIESLTLSGETSVTYDGKQHKPVVATVLTSGCYVTGDAIESNFTFEYKDESGNAVSDFKDAGKIIVHVTISEGNTNFENGDGDISVTFEILKRSLTEIGVKDSDLEIEYYISETSDSNSLGSAAKWTADSQVYVGQFVVPKIFHKNFGAENVRHQLTDKTDYRVVYELQQNVEGDVWTTVTEVKNVGRYRLNIKTELDDSGTLAKNYADFYTMEYNVYAAEFSPDTIEVEYWQNDKKLENGQKIELVYNGEAQTINVKDQNGGTYVVLRDKRTGEGIVPQETPLVYGQDFEIVNENGGNEQVTVNGAGEVQTQVTPVKGYINNVEVGTANLFLKGKGNFQDHYIIIEFVIKPLTMVGDDGNFNKDDFTFELDLGDEPFVYKNAAFEPKLKTAKWKETDLKVSEDYTISYENNINATAEGNRAKAKIKGNGNFEGEFVLEFDIQKHSISAQDIAVKMTKTFEYTGSAINPEVVVTMGDYQLNSDGRNDYVITYEFDEQGDENWAPVDAAQCVQKGKYRVVITGQGNFSEVRYEDFEITPFVLTGDKIIKDGSAAGVDTWALEDVEFDWAEHKVEPKLQLRLGDGSTKDLVKGQDYDLAYDTENFVDVKTIKITVTGMGDYSGTLYFTYKITPADISKAERFTATAEGFSDNMEVPFKNSEYKFDFTISDNKKPQEASQNVTFDIEYQPENTTSVGQVTITLKGTGNFGGTITKTFTIKAVKFDDDGNVSGGQGGEEELPKLTIGELENFTYDGKSHEQGIELHFGEYLLVSGDDYDIHYTNDGGFINAQTIGMSIVGKGNFSFTLTRSYTIAKVDIASGFVTSEFLADFGAERVFTGDPYTIGFNLKYTVDDSDLGVTYTVKYTQNGVEDNANVNAGTVTMTIEGTGNYTGTITNTFVIKPKNLADFEEKDFTYKHSVQWADVEVTQEELSLRYNGKSYTASDLTFTLTYENNNSINDNAIIHITGKGNFEGEFTLAFRIVAKVIDQDKIEVEVVYPEGKGGYDYTGEEIVPQIKVTVTDDQGQQHELTEDDFRINYEDDHTNVGSHNFSVDLVGDYAGQSATKSFTILAVSLENAGQDAGAIEMTTPEDVTYDGLAHTLVPTLSIKAGEEQGYVLKQGQDFTVEYYTQDKGTETETDFINAHTIYFKVSAHGANFTGEVWGSYQILAKDLSDTNEVTMEYQVSWAYTGQEVKPDVTVTYKSANNTIILQKDVNFTVSYSNNTHVTTEAQIVVSSTGSDANYTGSRTLTFSIGAVSLNDYQGITIDPISQQKYMARDIEPKVVVRLNGQEVVNTDNSQYTISYKRDTAMYPTLSETDHENVGFVTIVITAADGGNFVGTTETTFEIVAQDLAEAKVQLKSASGDFADWVDGTQYTFLGTDIKPGSEAGDLKVTIAGFTDERGELIEIAIGSEIALAYTDDSGRADTLNVGNKKLTISAVSSNFIGTKEQTYQIVALDLINPGEDGDEQQITVEVVGWKNQMVYHRGDEVPQTYDENEENGYSLRINGVIVDPSMYSVNYTYTRDGQKVIVGSAYATFVSNLSVGGNFTGSIVMPFEVVQADVWFAFISPETRYEEQEFATIFNGMAKETFNHTLTVDGTFVFSIDGQVKTSVEVGSHTYNFVFTPTDTHNYKGGSGTVTINGEQLVVTGIVATNVLEDEKPYIDGQPFNENSLRVEAYYNDPTHTPKILTRSEFDIVGLVDGYLSYENQFMVVYKANTELYDTIFVRPTTLGGEDGVEVRSSEGFKEGISMKLEKISDIEKIREYLSETALGKLSNISYLYRIVFYQNVDGEDVEIEQPDFDYEVWINLNKLEGGHVPYGVNGDEVVNLAELADQNGYVQLTPVTAKIVLVAVKRGIWTNWIFWIILIAVIIFLLILTILILVYLREQRKRENQRKLVAKTNG